MKESNLRKFHRNMGISLVVFIVLQAGSGFLISTSELSAPHSHAHEKQAHEKAPEPAVVSSHANEVHEEAVVSPLSNEEHEETVMPSNAHEEEESLWHESLEFVHHGAGPIGTIYRLLAGFGILGMAVSGSMIFFKIRARSR
jgi:hypothetical protein